MSYWLMVAALAASPQDAAQIPAEPVAPSETDIPDNFVIIIGDVGGKERRVIVGSRLARTPRYSDLSVATNTGVMGLTPGSGMDPVGGGFTRKIHTKSCISDDERISKPAACFLAAALAAEAEGDLRFAFGALNSMARSDRFSAVERMAAARHFYRLAEVGGNRETRFFALGLLLDTEGLPGEEEGAIRRTMIALALNDDKRGLAREMLGELVDRGLADARSLANYAVLLREADDQRAVSMMEQAIAAAETAGEDVPAGWRESARPASPYGNIGGS